MNLMNQLTSTVKRLFKNAPALITKIGVFMILTLILGSVFSDSFNPVENEEIKVAYVLEDDGAVAKNIMRELSKNQEIGAYLSFLEVENFEAAEESLAAEEYNAILLVQNGFSEQIMKGGSAQIMVYMTSYATTEASVVQSCLQGFLNQVNARILLSADGTDAPTESISANISSLEGNRPDSMTYYAIAMLLMMLFYGADYGNSGIAEDYFGAIGDRLSIAPVSKLGMFVGKILGTALVNFLLGCIIVAFTSLAFNANWGCHYPLLLLILFEFSLLSVVLGAFLCLALGNEQRASVAIQMFALGFTIVSGGFYAGDFKMVKYASFNHYAKAAITNLIYNETNLSVTWKNAGILLGILLVLIAACVATFRRRKAGNL